MTEKIKKRLRSRAGESIAEVLIAVMISVLGLALLAGMIASSRNVIAASKAGTAAYIGEENKLAVQPGTDGAASSTVSVLSGGDELKLTDAGSSPVSVGYYSTTVGNTTVASYKVS